MPEVKMTKYMEMSSIWVLSGCQADGYRPIVISLRVLF